MNIVPRVQFGHCMKAEACNKAAEPKAKEAKDTFLALQQENRGLSTRVSSQQLLAALQSLTQATLHNTHANQNLANRLTVLEAKH